MSFGLDAAIRALTAASLGIQTAGNNVANAATPGYSRQRLLLSSALPVTVSGGFQIGTGVEVNGVVSTVDEGLEVQLRLQLAASGRALVDVRSWTEIEGLFNEPAGGLGSQLSDLFAKIGTLQNDASDLGLRSGVIQSAKGLTANLNLLADRLSAIERGTFDQVDALVRQVNEHAAAIAKLNDQIIAAEANGSRANDLRDTRAQRIKDISQIVEVRAIEQRNGSVDVSLDGRTLVSGTRSVALRAFVDDRGATQITVGKSKAALVVRSGQIAGFLANEGEGARRVRTELDRLAYNLAFEVNRVHTTGVPRSGSFTGLSSFYSVADSDGDGQRGDELLAQADLPFPVTAGELFVTVTNRTTGEIERSRIDIDPSAMTLDDLADALTKIPHVSASVDPTGRFRVNAESGFGFDFGNRLDTTPDSFGSFGGAAPSIASTDVGPFDLSAALAAPPATFTAVIDGNPVPITLAPGEFVDPTSVTVDELVAAINSDLGTAGKAANVGGRLVIRSNSSGASATLALTDGTGAPLAALGLATGATRNGQDQAVSPKINGTYTGASNGRLVFVPDGDGQIGVTPGLTVSVFDAQGIKIATLDVGSTYSPGSSIEVADGVSVSFGPGNLSATFQDVFAVDTIHDSDTSDVLVALGLNSFFHGTNASDLSVNRAIETNPDLLAAGLSGAQGDASNLARLMNLRGTEIAALDDKSIEDFYSGIVGGVGFDSASAQHFLEAQDALLHSIQEQRDSVSGVNIDEETVDMLRYQQAFEAASRFVSVVTEITETLMNIAR